MSKQKGELPEQPCVVCGKMIPVPMIYCSSKCKEEAKHGYKDHIKQEGDDVVCLECGIKATQLVKPK